MKRDEEMAAQAAEKISVPASLFYDLVQRLIEDLARATTVTITTDKTSERMGELKRQGKAVIGQSGLHGLYVGVARGYDGEPDGILELVEAKPEGSMTWEQAKAWAESLGARLPTRKEQALLFANLPEHFEQAYYWSCEQHAAYVDYAWLQVFSDGTQLHHQCYRSLKLLGFEVKDAVTKFTGVVVSVTFDLYGCVQAYVVPKADKTGKIGDGNWFDIKRLQKVSSAPVMAVPKWALAQAGREPGAQALPAYPGR